MQGPGSLARSHREKKEKSAQEDLNSQKQQSTSRKSLHRSARPAWIGVADEAEPKPQAEPAASMIGKAAAARAEEPSVHDTQQELHPSYCSGTSEGYGTAATPVQDRVSRLQALQRLHGTSVQDSPLQSYPRVQEPGRLSRKKHGHHAKGGKGNDIVAFSTGRGVAAHVQDQTSSKVMRAEALQSQNGPSKLVPNTQESHHDTARGRSSTPIDRLRRLQRTRTSSIQPHLESMHSSPGIDPPSHAAALTVATESSSRFSNANRQLAHAEHGVAGVKSGQQEQIDVARKENKPGGMLSVLVLAAHKVLCIAKKLRAAHTTSQDRRCVDLLLSDALFAPVLHAFTSCLAICGPMYCYWICSR
jgi:hypothetical protein